MEVHGKRAESGEESQSKGIQKFCQPCEYKNVATKAHGICLEREEYMCNTCFRNHQTIKLCRHHELAGMDTPSLSKETEEKCKKHDNEAVKFYCRTHDIVGCGDCIILEHSTYKPEYIKNLSKGFQEDEEFKSLMRKLGQLQSTNPANDEKIQNNRKVCKVMHAEALKDLRKFRADINKYLDKAESDIITQAEQLKLDNDIRRDKLQQECERLSSNLETLKQKLNTDIHRENVLFIHAVNCKPIVKNIEQEVAKVLSENKVKRFKFVPDEQLVKIVTSTRKFGCLNISESKLSAGQESAMSLNEAEKHTVRNIDSQDKAKEVRPDGVCVGARVRAVLRAARIWALGDPGTVTAVHSDGMVNVKWDASGLTDRYTIGPEGQVKLLL